MSSDTKRKIFAHNLKAQIEKTGLERIQICAMTGIKYNAMCEWIMGHRYPRVDTIDRLARFFGCRVSDLTEEQTPEEMRISSLVDVFTQLDEEGQKDLIAYARFKLSEQISNEAEDMRETFARQWKMHHSPMPTQEEEDEAFEVAFAEYVEGYKRKREKK